MIVMVALDGEMVTAPADGFDKDAVKVSGPSTYESWLIRTTKVFDVSPAANFNVPKAVVKSQRDEASPLAVEQGSNEAVPSEVA